MIAMGAALTKSQVAVVEAGLGVCLAGVVRVAAVALHELAHYFVARWLGYVASVEFGLSAVSQPQVQVHGISASVRHAAIIRHAGWAFSVCLAGALSMALRELLTPATRWLVLPSAVAVWLTALDAMTSDLLGHEPRKMQRGRFGTLCALAQRRPHDAQYISCALRCAAHRTRAALW